MLCEKRGERVVEGGGSGRGSGRGRRGSAAVEGCLRERGAGGHRVVVAVELYAVEVYVAERDELGLVRREAAVVGVERAFEAGAHELEDARVGGHGCRRARC